MVIFYGDESGTHGKGDYVISGYLAHKSTWDLFNQEWPRFLGVAGIDFLKMSQWEHRDPAKQHSGHFCGMTNIDACVRLDAMVELLCSLLTAGAIAEYSVSISWDLYRQHINGDCKRVFDDPYCYLMVNIVRMALHDLHRTSPDFNDKIDFVFDSGSSGERHAQEHFGLLKTYSPPELAKHIGTLDFDDDKGCPPLQAADLIAWHTRRALAGFPKDDDGSRRRRYERLRSSTHAGITGVATEELLVDFNNRVNKLSTRLATESAALASGNDDPQKLS